MSGDLFGYTPEPEPFTDIRNQRDSVAEEKAVLCMQLTELCRKVPPSICGASIEKTRAFMHARSAAKSITTTRTTLSRLTSRNQLRPPRIVASGKLSAIPSASALLVV